MDRIYRYHMTTTSGGNLSILDPDGSIWIKPSRVQTHPHNLCGKVAYEACACPGSQELGDLRCESRGGRDHQCAADVCERVLHDGCGVFHADDS